jgi:L-malate glycosyltransferase
MKQNKKKHILMYTRPIAPPWDEASKGLAYDIAVNSDGTFNFHLLTTSEYALAVKKTCLAGKDALTAEPLFSSSSFDAKAKRILLARLLRKEVGADLVHFLFTPRPLTSFLFRVRLAFSETKTIQTLATIDKKIIKDARLLKKVLFADRIIAQSYVTESKLKNAGIDNVQVIYPGINLERYFPQPKNEKLLEELGIKKDEIVVLFAGEYTRLKAIDDIILAFEQIFKDPNKEIQKIKLILACRIKSQDDVKKQEKIEAGAKKGGYLERIVFLATVENMPRLFNISDINIFPVQEMAGKFDIPLAIVEAMACQKATIVSDIDVLTEFVDNNRTGIVISKGSPTQLRDSILKLATNKEERARLAKNAKTYVHANFDIRNVVKKYKIVYTELLNEES